MDEIEFPEEAPRYKSRPPALAAGFVCEPFILILASSIMESGVIVISFIANWFIDFFGITHPTERQKRLAGWFIVGLMTATLAALGGIAAMLFYLVRP